MQVLQETLTGQSEHCPSDWATLRSTGQVLKFHPRGLACLPPLLDCELLEDTHTLSPLLLVVFPVVGTGISTKQVLREYMMNELNHILQKKNMVINLMVYLIYH